MAKTTTLMQFELQELREKIQIKFSKRNPSKVPIKTTSYKEAYEDLRKDILFITECNEMSVSLGRLRKLFYYTNPEVYSKEKQENATFGKDFIEVLEKYTDDIKKSKTSLSDKKSNDGLKYMLRVGVGLIFFGIIFFTIKHTVYNQYPVQITDNYKIVFAGKNLEDLKKEG